MQALLTKPTLIGERLRLVPLGPAHVDVLYESLHDEETRRLTGTHRTFSRDDIEAWCASRAEQPDRLDFAIEALDTGEFLGDLAVPNVDPPNETASFRIALGPEHVGKGYGPEATRLLLRYLFDEVGVHRVQLEVFDFNERAIRSYEKSGFVHEGRLRDELLWDGVRYDTLVMSVLRTD